MASSDILIQLEEEVEGNHQGSDDIFFVKIGEAVPIKHGVVDSEFQLQSLPSRPLAVSQRDGLLFVAHSTGICVARTKDVLVSAREIEDKGSGSCIQDLSVVDLPLEKVHILALSADCSTLAACIDAQIHLFSVASLLNKEQEPSFSCSLNDSSYVKDIQWTTKLENCYVVLSSCGKLYYGDGHAPLKDVMDNVDAVEWSVKGNYVAVARKNILSILSSKFKHRLSMSLLFKSWTGDSNAEYIIKVDTIRWIRSDCIIIGCFQLTTDGKVETYVVQVITCEDGRITDVSSKPVVLCFDDVFEGLIDDIVPFESGPHMLLSYLDQCGLAVTANRRSTGQQLALFGWSVDDKKNEVAIIDLLRDSWLPRIELQENGDDNLILGLCVDNVSENEKVELKIGEEEKKLSPYCIILCLTMEGKLVVFHVASVTEASFPAEIVSELSYEEGDSPSKVPSDHGLSKISLRLAEQSMDSVYMDSLQEIKEKENTMKRGDEIPMKNDPKLPVLNKSMMTGPFNDQIFREETISKMQEVKTNMAFPESEPDGQQKGFALKLNQDTGNQEELPSGKQGTNLEQAFLQTSRVEGTGPVARDFSKIETQNSSGFQSSSDSISRNVLTDSSNQSVHIGSQSVIVEDKEVPGYIGSTSLQTGIPQSCSKGHVSFSKIADGGSLFLPLQNKKTDNCRSVAHFLGDPTGKPFQSRDTVRQSTPANPSGIHSGQRTSTGVRNIGPLPATPSSQFSSQGNYKFHLDKEKNRMTSSTGLLNSEPYISKQSGNVEEMAKELEALWEFVEGPGGFRDASTVLQESSVVALEKGIQNLSDRCRIWRSIMEEQIGVIQQLLDSTVRVLARKIYMEGIVKQAIDSQYWDLWNRQKLGSELELKRQNILRVNQDLTNQLIELERHFNTLELDKFGENDTARVGQRALPKRYGPSRHVQSLHSLHNTMSSQLTAAEKLSKCLSNQMALLSIGSNCVTKQNMKKELFETIGILYSDAPSSCPETRKAGETSPSNKELLISKFSAAVKDHSRRNQSSVMKSSEVESARRRRDSLDRSWASFEPSKTTVKRMLLREEPLKGSTNRSSFSMNKQRLSSHMLEESALACQKLPTTSSTFLNASEKKGTSKASIRQACERPSTIFGGADDLPQPSHSLGLKSPTVQVLPRNKFSTFSQQSANVPSPIASQSSPRGSFDMPAQRASSGTIGTEKSHSCSINESDCFQQSEIHPLQMLDSMRLPLQAGSLTKEPCEMSNSNDKETNLPKIVNHRPTATESSCSEPERVCDFPLSPVPASVPSPSPSATRKTQPGEMTSSSTSSLSILNLSSPPIISSSPPSQFSLPGSSITPNSASAVSEGRLFRGSKAKDPPQTASQSKLSLSSSLDLSFTSSNQAAEKLIPSSNVPALTNSTYESQKTEPQPPVAKFNSKAVENSVTQTSPTAPGPQTGTVISKHQSSLVSTPISEPMTKFQSVNQLSFSGMTNTEVQQPFASHALSSDSFSASESATGAKTGISNVTVAQEDEMEEEAPETNLTTELTLGNLNTFGIGSAPNPTASKPNPFAMTFGNAAASPVSPSFTMTVPPRELFRPASFAIQSPQQSPPSQPTNFGAFSGGFGTGATAQIPAGSGFGQPAQIGPGQQALGSVLGAFGQSRQLGTGISGSSAASVGSFVGGIHPTGGFLNAGSGSGFSGIASGGGGFATAATAVGGGFAAAATAAGGGFAAAASAGGGFAAAAAGSAGGGFAGAASGSGFGITGGGFGAFSNQAGNGNLSAFGSGAGGTPPSQLFTQMRK